MALDEIAALFRTRGMQSYLGEVVTLAQQMLQAAGLAEAAGAQDRLVAAALLHDIGHVLREIDAGHVSRATEANDRHAESGADWIARWFPEEVTTPVRLHVAAKRYLCATESDYARSLSLASQKSLIVQGGPMNADEVQAFEQLPYARAAVAVRHWDEAAKDPSAATPDFDHFAPLLTRLAQLCC